MEIFSRKRLYDDSVSVKIKPSPNSIELTDQNKFIQISANLYNLKAYMQSLFAACQSVKGNLSFFIDENDFKVLIEYKKVPNALFVKIIALGNSEKTLCIGYIGSINNLKDSFNHIIVGKYILDLKENGAFRTPLKKSLIPNQNHYEFHVIENDMEFIIRQLPFCVSEDKFQALPLYFSPLLTTLKNQLNSKEQYFNPSKFNYENLDALDKYIFFIMSRSNFFRYFFQELTLKQINKIQELG